MIAAAAAATANYHILEWARSPFSDLIKKIPVNVGILASEPYFLSMLRTKKSCLLHKISRRRFGQMGVEREIESVNAECN